MNDDEGLLRRYSDTTEYAIFCLNTAKNIIFEWQMACLSMQIQFLTAVIKTEWMLLSMPVHS